MQHTPQWARGPDSLADNLHSADATAVLQNFYPKTMSSSASPAIKSTVPVAHPEEVPIHTTALMQGVTKAVRPGPQSTKQIPSAPTSTEASSHWSVMESHLRPQVVLTSSPVEYQTIDTTGSGIEHSEWYERTSTHVLGMIFLMLIAIVIVEAYEKTGGFCKRRRTSGRLRLKGRERRLWKAGDEKTDTLIPDIDLLRDMEETEDFWEC